ncbi:hypothetical protein CO152_05170 [bacterium CG_4_9_14_3_um_filter_33_26]|nr:MAG: hypothetical protein CO152_05170 [bacterium CG_4_9_14_3_um_filter_33_26]
MRKKEIKKDEKNSKEEFFFSDLKDIQLISGATIFSAVIVTFIAVLILPAKQVDSVIIVYTGILVFIFVAIYYTNPSFYLNPRLMLLPDIVCVIAIAVVSNALKGYGDSYIAFYFIVIAVDAFAFRFKDFLTVIIMTLVALIFSNIFILRGVFTTNEIIFRSMIQIYSIIATAVIMRFFAKEALTERLEKEKIKRLAENTLSAIKQLRSLLDSIGDGVFAVDKSRKIILANTAAVSFLDWDKPISGKNINDVMQLYSENMQKIDPVKRVIETKKPLSSSDFIVLKSGKQQKYYVNITPLINLEGHIQGAIVLFRDITREKELEEQKAEFVAVSSHELRTPLTIIEGYLYYILSSKGLKYDDRTKIYIEKAHKGCLSLQRLISDLLEVSRAERNKLKLFLEDVDIVDLSKELVSEFQDKVKESGLQLILDVKPVRIPHCFVDKDRVKEVLVNLVGNALKFTEKGYIKISICKKDKYIQVGVTDTGIGIKKEDQKFIFNKFYRIEGWQTRKTGGTGLGLYISRSIVEKLHGKIWLESQYGKGSTFYFTLLANIKNKKKIQKKPKGSKELKEFVRKL